MSELNLNTIKTALNSIPAAARKDLSSIAPSLAKTLNEPAANMYKFLGHIAGYYRKNTEPESSIETSFAKKDGVAGVDKQNTWQSSSSTVTEVQKTGEVVEKEISKEIKEEQIAKTQEAKLAEIEIPKIEVAKKEEKKPSEEEVDREWERNIT